MSHTYWLRGIVIPVKLTFWNTLLQSQKVTGQTKCVPWHQVAWGSTSSSLVVYVSNRRKGRVQSLSNKSYPVLKTNKHKSYPVLKTNKLLCEQSSDIAQVQTAEQ